MHDAVKKARDLQSRNAELAARVALSEELIQRLREESQKLEPLKLENAQLKSEVTLLANSLGRFLAARSTP